MNNFTEGCQADLDFTGEMAGLYEYIGMQPSKRLLSNLSTASVSVSVLISFFRMSKHYKFRLLPKKTKIGYFAIFCLVFVVGGEVAIDYFNDTRFPECPNGFTPVEHFSDTFLENKWLLNCFVS